MTPHDAIHTAFTPLADAEDCEVVVDFVGDAELALLGEASHGFDAVLHFDHTSAVRASRDHRAVDAVRGA